MPISSLFLAFFTGVVSSFGHCLGMCGGIVAVYSARQPALAAAGDSRPGVVTRLGALSPLHLGRILTYTILGTLVGLAGTLLEGIGGLVGLQGAFSIVVGLVMIAVALSLMGILPPVEVVLAAVTTRVSPMKRMRSLFGRSGLWSTLALGMTWGLLPCGLVYAMLVVAAGTGTPWGGALTMASFGLGTVPTLLGFGLAANMLSPQLRARLQLFTGLLIFLFAVQTILRGLAAANVISSLIIGPVMLW